MTNKETGLPIGKPMTPEQITAFVSDTSGDMFLHLAESCEAAVRESSSLDDHYQISAMALARCALALRIASAHAGSSN